MSARGWSTIPAPSSASRSASSSSRAGSRPRCAGRIGGSPAADCRAEPRWLNHLRCVVDLRRPCLPKPLAPRGVDKIARRHSLLSGDRTMSRSLACLTALLIGAPAAPGAPGVAPLAAQEAAELCKAIGKVTVGQWASYDATGRLQGKVRFAIVGTEQFGDTTFYWFEINGAGAGPQG